MNPADLATWRQFAQVVFISTNSLPAQHYPQVRYDYDGDGNLVYVGIAPRGAASSAEAWIIWKLSYTSSRVTQQQSTLPNQIWDDRVTASYA